MTLLARFLKAKRALTEGRFDAAVADLEAIAARRHPVGHMARQVLDARLPPRGEVDADDGLASSRLSSTHPAASERAGLDSEGEKALKSQSRQDPGASLRRDGITISELEAEISRVEKVRVLLSSAMGPSARFRPYGLTSPSTGSMTADEFARLIGRIYPGIDCLSPRGGTMLDELRAHQR